MLGGGRKFRKLGSGTGKVALLLTAVCQNRPDCHCYPPRPLFPTSRAVRVRRREMNRALLGLTASHRFICLLGIPPRAKHGWSCPIVEPKPRVSEMPHTRAPPGLQLQPLTPGLLLVETSSWTSSGAANDILECGKKKD